MSNVAPLVVSNVSKSYPKGKTGEKVAAVQDVSFSVRSGEIVAFLGPNGAGKTTTIKLISGLVTPDAGEVLIVGENLGNNRSVYRHLSILLDQYKYGYARRRVNDTLRSFAVLKGLSNAQAKSRCDQLLELLGLQDKANVECRALSKGMEQKLNLAVCLINEPKLLLLDEPTNGLDVEATEQTKVLLRKLASQGLAILLTTHMLDVAQAVSDRVIVINKGSIIAEDTTQVLLKRFSGDIYKIRFSGSLSESQQSALAELEAACQCDGELILPGDSVKFYRALEVLRPNPVLSVTTGDTSLTEVFLKLIGGQRA